MKIEQLVLAPPWRDGEGLATCRDGRKVVDLVGKDASGIDDDPRLDRAACGGDEPVAPGRAGKPADASAEEEVHAIVARVLCQSDGEAEGVHDACRGRPEGRHGAIGDVGLQGDELLASNDAQVAHAVGDPALEQGLECGQVARIGADDERADLPEGEVEVAGKLGKERAALDVESRHERTRRRVKARMHDGRVGLRGARAYVVLRLDDAEPPVEARKLACHGTAAHAGADDDGVACVVDHCLSPPGHPIATR